MEQGKRRISKKMLLSNKIQLKFMEIRTERVRSKKNFNEMRLKRETKNHKSKKYEANMIIRGRQQSNNR